MPLELDELVTGLLDQATFYDFVPLKQAYKRDPDFWTDQDLRGAYDPSTKTARQTLSGRIRDEAIPLALERDKGLVCDYLQIYVGRECRDILVKCTGGSFDFSVKDVVSTQLSQWKHALGKDEEECLVQISRVPHLARISSDWHSEALSARCWLYQWLEWKRHSLVESEINSLRVRDTSIDKCDPTSASIEYINRDGRPVLIVFPVARQWKRLRRVTGENEEERLVDYFQTIKSYAAEIDCHLEIHCPRISRKAEWKPQIVPSI